MTLYDVVYDVVVGAALLVFLGVGGLIVYAKHRWWQDEERRDAD